MNKFLGVKIADVVEVTGGPYTGSKILMFADAEGRDWYTTRQDWAGVVMVQPETNLVCALETDVERLSLCAGTDLYEIDPGQIPSGFYLGKYIFSNGEFIESNMLV